MIYQSPWDCAAGILLIEEAGGKITNYDGSKITTLQNKNAIIASNTHLHEEFFKQIKNV